MDFISFGRGARFSRVMRLRCEAPRAENAEVCISYLPEDVLLHSAEERKKWRAEQAHDIP